MTSGSRDIFRRQAGWCDALGSPFTAVVCRTLFAHLSEESAFGAKLLNWPGDPGADALALRACGALNLLAREGHPSLASLYPPNPSPSEDALWRGVAATIASDDARLASILDSPPQTNEVARSALLLTGYLTIARLCGLPLAIREIGASAGLNLLFDRFAYDYGWFAWGASDASVRIGCEWRGNREEFSPSIAIADRRGCDSKPIDAGNAVERERMLAYIWPDQEARITRAAAALRLAASQDIRVEAIDAALFGARELAAGQDGRVLTLVHSIVWQYLPQTTKAALKTSIAQAAGRATRTAPFAWLRMETEPPLAERGAALRLSLWPHGVVDRLLAVVDYHGRWIEWSGLA
ncbi:MAG TPA: DUF2332 family protein [Roseiarcus sp.]|nr:DUF2332 family protein [Roseiarcus sp.]